jgi:hypothetical protein
MPKKLRWLRSPTGLDGKPWKNWRRSRSRIRCWAWYRKLIANKFDGSKFRKSWGRPRVDQETERLVVRMAKENPGWGYDRIVGAMVNLGIRLSDQTVGNILRRRKGCGVGSG